MRDRMSAAAVHHARVACESGLPHTTIWTHCVALGLRQALSWRDRPRCTRPLTNETAQGGAWLLDLLVFLAVLTAAAFHAGWNALLKLNVEPIVATSLVAVTSGVVVVPLAVVVGLPVPASWPYVAGSAIVHIGYYFALARAYRFGDLGHVYPIARGTAPLMTALLAAFWLGEAPGPYGWAGIVLLTGGILLLAVKGRRALQAFDVRSVGFALLTSLTITVYTLIDGLGARISGSPLQYTAWLFVLSGVTMGIYGFATVGRPLASAFAAHWKMAIAGGVLSTAAYAIAIWAMTVAPIALVAALRETSVLFAALLSVALLREPLVLARIGAAFLVLVGMVLVRLR
jgi:drug/metabolite transporter (DMT)-like permease